MKQLRGGEATHGIEFDKPQAVEVGQTYGHLEVLEKVPKAAGHERRWRCRCLNVPDKETGKMCGQITLKRTHELTKPTKFRACKACIELYMGEVRQKWNRRGFF